MDDWETADDDWASIDGDYKNDSSSFSYLAAAEKQVALEVKPVKV